MNDSPDRLKAFYEEAFHAFDADRPPPPLSVEFYPYVGINHTIRVRDGRVFVRLAEICRRMPLAEHRALAFILVAKLLRRRVPAKARAVYAAYVKGDEMRAAAVARKRERGKKIVTSAQGEIYDLSAIFDELNRAYFKETLPKPVLTWSARRTYRILGHHDSAHETIVVSRSLDDKKVPRYVVEFVVFHEMLHIFHPTEHRDGRRYNHTPAFRRNERKFRHYEKAESWIESNVKHLKRRAKK